MIHVRIHGMSGGSEHAELIREIQRRFTFALDRFAHSIREVEVSLSDVNGPRGGIDKICRVRLRLYPRGILVAKSASSSLQHAARDAGMKVRQMLSRRLEKRTARIKRPVRVSPPVIVDGENS